MKIAKCSTCKKYEAAICIECRDALNLKIKAQEDEIRTLKIAIEKGCKKTSEMFRII